MILGGATVLLVDDELTLLEIFRTWLERERCRVLSAVNGAEALKLLGAERVDAVVSDVRMPVMDGMALARQVHLMGQKVPPFILVSGSSDFDLSEARRLGVIKVLEKPLRRTELIDALEVALRRLEQARAWSDASAPAALLPATVVVEAPHPAVEILNPTETE